jgi:hypothetical protein
MAMKVALAARALLFVGLLALFLGQRALAHLDSAPKVLTGLGLACLLFAFATQGWRFAKETGKARSVEGLRLISYAGIAVAMLVYFFVAAKSDSGKTQTMATMAWLIILGISLVPLLMVEVSFGIVNSWEKRSTPHRTGLRPDRHHRPLPAVYHLTSDTSRRGACAIRSIHAVSGPQPDYQLAGG